MKFPMPFRKTVPRGIDPCGLQQAFDAAAKPEDAGERLMRFHDVGKACDAALSKLHDKMCNRVLGPTALGGAGVALAGFFTMNPFLAAGGMVVAMSGLGLSEIYCQDVRQAITKLRESSNAAADDLRQNIGMEDLARSGRFDDIMKTYPDLKDKFVVAASREKVLKPEKPVLQRRPPGFEL